MILHIDGREVVTIAAFHEALIRCGKFPDHYGANLMALSDSLTGDVERPFSVIWDYHEYSKRFMPKPAFDRIVETMQKVQQRDAEVKKNKEHIFTLTLK